MDTYLFSMHPKWCERIFNGEKTIEVRKTAPKPPFKVVVYCTKGNTKIYLGKDRIFHTNCAYDFETGELLENILMNGKAIGEFICNEVSEYRCKKNKDGASKYTISEKDFKDMAIDGFDLFDYADGKDLYGIHITAPKLYGEPKELGEFRKADRKNPTCGYSYCCKAYCGSYDYCTAREVTRPPQSYMRIQDPKEE